MCFRRAWRGERGGCGVSAVGREGCTAAGEKAGRGERGTAAPSAPRRRSAPNSTGGQERRPSESRPPTPKWVLFAGSSLSVLETPSPPQTPLCSDVNPFAAQWRRRRRRCRRVCAHSAAATAAARGPSPARRASLPAAHTAAHTLLLSARATPDLLSNELTANTRTPGARETSDCSCDQSRLHALPLPHRQRLCIRRPPPKLRGHSQVRMRAAG